MKPRGSNSRRTSTAIVSAAVLTTTAVLTAQPGDSDELPAAQGVGVAPASTSSVKGPPIVPLPPPRDFVTTVDNPYSPFIPGTRWVYVGGTPDERERTVVKVLTRSKLIEGIRATVVRDTVRVGGEVVEDTFDWFGQDRRGRVWYLGEATKTYEDGRVVSTEGSWEAGVDGARAGIVMPAHPRTGRPYRQEYYPGYAEDQAKLLTLDTRAATEAGVFTHLRMTEETTALEPDTTEIKLYAPGVGVVLELDLSPEAGRTELVRFTSPT
jgi:hypothetical protein